jgi:hypothetical protein
MRCVLVLDRIVFILSLIPVSVFLLLVRKLIVLDLDLQMKKNVFVFLIRPNILCIKYVFGGISCLRQYRILVSLSKDNTCVLSQESETTQIWYFWVFKF